MSAARGNKKDKNFQRHHADELIKKTPQGFKMMK
jgi:hypothetical protein